VPSPPTLTIVATKSRAWVGGVQWKFTDPPAAAARHRIARAMTGTDATRV